MLDEDRTKGGEMQNLLQVMGSYLDSLYLQVTQMTKFHEAEYQDNNSVAANPHNRKLLTSLGFDIPDMFIDKNVLETILDQDDKRKFEDKLNEIKNLVYKNIYNNLNYINKSKGTVKSIRNLLRCYGIDDDLFNFNVYADKAEYFIKDDYKNSSIKFDSLDLTPFANPQNTEGVIYNFSETGNPDTAPFISGSTEDIYLPFTVEANTIFPKTPPTYSDDIDLTEPAIVTASVFGVREAFDSTSTGVPDTDDANISVRVIKNDNTAKFQLSSSLGVLLESDRFYDVYDNSRWSLSVRVKYDLDPFTVVSGSGPWTLEFNGYNYIQDVMQNSFGLTSSLTAAQGTTFTATDKRVYAGAEKENITGTLTHRSNMKLLSVLAWADYLEDQELKSHARDVTSFGRERSYKNAFSFRGNNLDNIFIPKFDSLAMNLAFNQVTSSDASGEFVVPDLSSGSLALTTKYAAEDYSKIVGIQHTAQGKGFPVSSDVKDIQYLNIMTQQIPENLNTDNMIEILDRDDDKFFIDARPVKYFFSLEASMYDTISREMLKTFAGVLDYASMIGSPIVDHQVYPKEMRLARQNFFERVENEPDLEKYVQLYKFLDSAIESVLFNLMPASANASDRVRTVIENHLFERSHVVRVLAPGKNTDTQNTIGNKTVAGYSPGVANPIAPYESYYKAAPNDIKPKEVTGEDFISSYKNFNAHIQGSTFALETRRRDFPKFKGSKNPTSERNIEIYLDRYENKRDENSNDTDGQNAFYKLRAKRDRTDLDVYSTDLPLKTRTSIHSTYQRERHIDTSRGAKLKGNLLSNTIGPDDASTRKGSLILPIIQTEQAANTIRLTQQTTPNLSNDITKNFVTYNVDITNATSEAEAIQLVQNNLPVKFTEQTPSREFFLSGVGSVVNGHHTDIFYDTQDPLQGPFAEQHVGGYKHRHVELNQQDDRPELYKISVLSGLETVLHNPRTDETADNYHFHIPRVKFSRNQGLKKVYNVANIATTTGSKVLGNFDKNYQVVMTSGRRQNNFAFVQQGGFSIDRSESTAVSGVLDFALPTRSLSDGTFNKTVIVTRFSSPGEIATLSEGFLDVEAAELSLYNALPYRNRTAVNNLNDFLQIPTAFGGYQSGSATTASYHKVQRNSIKRIRTSATGGTHESVFNDNGFFNYQIPKSDFGYWWISSSAVAELSMDGLYGFAANSINTASYGISFLSASEVGSFFTTAFGGSRIYPVPDNAPSDVLNPSDFLPDNFVGLNYNIYEPIDTETNTLGHPAGTPYYDGTGGAEYQNTAFADALQALTAPALFNGLINKRNGPYGHPTFKQVRTGQHPVARNMKQNNVIVAPAPTGQVRVTHAPVSSKYKPVIHLLTSEESLGTSQVAKDLILTYPFASEYDFYGNYYDTINGNLRNPYPGKNFKILDKRDSLFYNISSLYTGKSTIENVNNIKLTSLFYSETIYPKETNAYLSKARDRSRFIFNWRDSITDRENKLTGSQGFGSFSYWGMDKTTAIAGELMDETSGSLTSDLRVRYGRYRLSGSAGYNNLSSSSPSNIVQETAGVGPFEDSYSKWNSDIRTIAKEHSIVPEYRISDNIEAIIDSGFDVSNDTHQSLSLTGSIATENNSIFLESFAHSDDIPAIEIVREIQERDASRISLKLSAVKKLLPYNGFYPVQRTLQLSSLFSSSVAPGTTTAGTDASFQTLNNTIFSRLTYGSIRAGIATDTAIWTSGELAVNQTAASATAEFSFNNGTDPEGFVLGLQNSEGTEFYRFDATHSTGDGSSGTPFIISTGGSTTGTDLALDVRAAVAASGTIGVSATNFGPIVGLTGSFDAGAAGNNNAVHIQGDGSTVAGGAIATTGFGSPTTHEGVSDLRPLLFTGGLSDVSGFIATSSFSRLPFETIIDPAAYLSQGIIENDPENFFDSTASVNYVKPSYALAASNFYAGVVDTFIKNNKLSTIKTKPESEWSFSDGSLSTYTMDVVVKKEANFSNHDDPAANGAPYTAHACLYQPLELDGEEYWSAHINEGSSSVDARIPPAASWSANEAIATINFDYDAFKTAVKERDIPTFGDILRFSTKTFKNKQMFEQLGSTQGTSSNTNQSQFMTIEAGVDLFNYDSATTQWTINTKCEFPAHNIITDGTALTAKYPNGTDGGTGQSAGDVNRGVWHQFLTNTESGLKLGVRGPSTDDNRTNGSLARACGFETEQKVISQLADSSELKEYLVAIPFVTNECEEESFFHYPIDQFEEAYTNINKERRSSLSNMLSLQRELILPPKLNYMARRDNADERLEQNDYGTILRCIFLK